MISVKQWGVRNMNGKKQTPSEQMRKLMNDLNFESINNKHDLRFNHGLSSYENPISTYFARHGFKQQTIYEGLITTYPIDKVVKWITDYFPTLKNLVKKKTASNGVEHILTIIPNVGDNASIVKRALDTCGYYPVLISFDVDSTGIEWVTIQFEPKFQKDETQDIRANQQYLYHISPAYNDDKIMQQGFSPRCKNELFNFPGRIYLINGTTVEDDIVNLGLHLSLYNRSKGNNLYYTVYKLDLDKVPEKIKLFKDPNYPNGVFTSDNLSPDCIIQIGHVDFNKDYPNIVWK